MLPEAQAPEGILTPLLGRNDLLSYSNSTPFTSSSVHSLLIPSSLEPVTWGTLLIVRPTQESDELAILVGLIFLGKTPARRPRGWEMWESRVLCGISKRGGNGGKVGGFDFSTVSIARHVPSHALGSWALFA